MPPAQLRVPIIRFLLGEPMDDQYSTIRNILYHFIVSIGYYHLWYYDIPDRERIWTIIFRIVRSVLNNIPDPGPNVAMPREFLLGVYHIYISCMKHILSNQRLMWDNYQQEYDRCVQSGQDTYTCHHRGVYAGNAVWGYDRNRNRNRRNLMVAPLHGFPTLIAAAPHAVRVGLEGFVRKERGPPSVNTVPPTSYLPTSFNFWIATYPGPLLPPDFALPPGSLKNEVDRLPYGNIAARLAALAPPGSLNIPDSHQDSTNTNI